MEDRLIEEDVKSRLILAGTRELLEHGVTDFSLRRVALEAQVSCAAPYRHFKDKNELILSIITGMRKDWNLLSGQICGLFTGDCKRLIVELCVAGVRFWNGGENFRSVLMSGYANTELEKFDAPISEAVLTFSKEQGLGRSAEEQLLYRIRTLFYGTVTLLSVSSLNIMEALDRMRQELEELLDRYASETGSEKGNPNR